MFIKLLKEYRTITNKTQAEMASILGISTNHLSRLERGISFPSGSLIHHITKVIAQDIERVSENTQNDNLYGLIILLHFEQLDHIERQLIFHETIKLIKLSNNR